MNSLNKETSMKVWQAVALLSASGFAFGTILAKTANVLGF